MPGPKRWHARRSFADEAAAPPAVLSLGVTSLVAGYVLSDLLARFRRAYPGISVTAIEDNGDYLEHLLIGGELDVAVMVISNLRDRNALMTRLSVLGQGVLDSPEVEQLRFELKRLVTDIHHHRQKVHDLAYDAVELELGGSE